MALGLFDETLRVEGWFDETTLIGGWFDESLIQQEAGSSPQTLTQSSRFDNAATFYTHALTQTAPAQTLTQSARHDNSNTFYAHVLTASIALSQSSRFDNEPTFYAHTLTPGAVALAQSARFDNDATFYSHTLNQAGGTQNLTQSAIFDNENTFYQHGIYHEQSISPSGGFTYPLDREHERCHISKSVRKIIKRIAKKQVEEQIEDVETVESQAFVQQLMTALAKADMQYKAFYAEILEQERQQLIDEEIKYLIGLKRMRDEEEEVLAVLMAMM